MICINESYQKPSYLKSGPDYLEYSASVTLDGLQQEVMIKAAGRMQAERELEKWCKESGAYSGQIKEMTRSI